MAAKDDPDSWQYVSDLDSINKEAQSRKERRDALDWCLENRWASKDIDCVERIDTDTKHGWKMKWVAGREGATKKKRSRR